MATWTRGIWVRVYLPLLAIDLFVMNIWSALTQIAPALDGRAHIFRISYFIVGMSNGDYTPIQYHGYSFLAGYGTLMYFVAQAPYLLLNALLHSELYAAVLTWNLIFVFTPLFLSLCVILLAEEVRPLSLNEKLLLATLALITTPILFVTASGAVPSVWSVAFALLALKYGLRNSRLGFLLSSCASIYSETFGYIYVFASFLLLFFIARKSMTRTIPAMVVITSFSWVQLLQVVGYMSPLISTTSNLFKFDARNLDWVFLVLAAIILACIYYARKGGLRARPYATVALLGLISLLIAGIALLRSTYHVNFGILNTFIDGIIPWRFMYLGVCIPLLIMWIGLGKWTKFRKGITAFLIIALILFNVYVGALPLSKYTSYPNGSLLQSLSGQNIIVADPYLSQYNSPVAFSAIYNYSTKTGAYSQGDPSFYYITAYYEWSRYFVNNSEFASNIMQLTGSTALEENGSSTFGPTTFLESNSTLADAVTPIYIVSSNPTDSLLFSLFINILGQNGYKLTFVTSSANSFGCVILGNQSVPTSCTSTITLNNTAVSYARSIFPHTPYLRAPYSENPNISSTELNYANSLTEEMIAFFHPVYEPLNVDSGPNSYKVQNYSGPYPVLLKVSYYPYFLPFNYTFNIYHFIILSSSTNDIRWNLPFYDISLIVSVASFLFVLVLEFYIRRRKSRFSLI